MLSTSPSSFLEHYNALVASGAIEADPAQARAAEAFGALDERLASYKPHRKQSLLGRLFGGQGHRGIGHRQGDRESKAAGHGGDFLFQRPLGR